MKNRIKYSLGTIVTVLICYYSACHNEKYHVLIPIIFGVLAMFSIIMLVTEKK